MAEPKFDKSLIWQGGIILAAIGWSLTVEQRLVSHERISNIEELVMPIVIEYEVQTRLQEREGTHNHSHDSVAPHMHDEPEPVAPESAKPDEERMRGAVEDEIRDKFEQFKH